MVDIPTAPPEAYENYFVQPLAPIGGSLVGSFFVGLIPLILVLILLGVLRMPAHYASFLSLVVCILIAIFGWHMPAQQAFSAIANGIVFANWPIMWIVVNAMWIYNISVRSGIFKLFRRWMLTNTPADKRVFLILIAYAFSAVLEGVAGFGTPGAICSALLVSLGYKPLDALTFVLLFDTIPVAFGALGIPITTLGSLTEIDPMKISAMLGRQLPLFSLFLPTYAMVLYAGPRAGFLECWPLTLVAGLSFSVIQGIFANLVGPELPDLLSGLVSMLAIIVFVRFWKPPFREEYRAIMVADPDATPAVPSKPVSTAIVKPTIYETVLAWSPWMLIVILVIIWTFAEISKYGEQSVQFPHLHDRVWLTLYGKPYDAIWDFQPLATGTAILIAGLLFDVIVLINGSSPWIIWYALIDTVKQLFFADLTVSLIMAFAYLYNYSGIVYTVGLTLSQVGRAFPFLSAWIGWIGCFLTGSDTSANSLFGNLQVVAAREIGLSKILMAATNTAGAVTAKLISPQTLSTGVSTIGMRGKEGVVLRRTIIHSILFVCLVGALTCFEQYVIPGIIPPGDD
ncbi:lactate permease [Lichtheimia hyalospora FSU 10163]|nr:lactate permease [Lichtheimia hyalospora FSU 10163]